MSFQAGGLSGGLGYIFYSLPGIAGATGPQGLQGIQGTPGSANISGTGGYLVYFSGSGPGQTQGIGTSHISTDGTNLLLTGGLNISSLAVSNVVFTDGSNNLSTGISCPSAYLSGLTSNVQTQLSSLVSISGTAGHVPVITATGSGLEDWAGYNGTIRLDTDGANILNIANINATTAQLGNSSCALTITASTGAIFSNVTASTTGVFDSSKRLVSSTSQSTVNIDTSSGGTLNLGNVNANQVNIGTEVASTIELNTSGGITTANGNFVFSNPVVFDNLTAGIIPVYTNTPALANSNSYAGTQTWDTSGAHIINIANTNATTVLVGNNGSTTTIIGGVAMNIYGYNGSTHADVGTVNIVGNTDTGSTAISTVNISAATTSSTGEGNVNIWGGVSTNGSFNNVTISGSTTQGGTLNLKGCTNSTGGGGVNIVGNPKTGGGGLGIVTIQGGAATTFGDNFLSLLAGPTATGGALVVGNTSNTDTVAINAATGPVISSATASTTAVFDSSKRVVSSTSQSTVSVDSASSGTVNVGTSAATTINIGTGGAAVNVGDAGGTGQIIIQTENTTLSGSSGALVLKTIGSSGNIYMSSGNTTGTTEPGFTINCSAATSGTAFQIMVGTGATPIAYLGVSTGGVWMSTSDERSKEEITDCEYGWDWIMKQTPVSYYMRGSKNALERTRQHGFLAQKMIGGPGHSRGPRHDFGDGLGYEPIHGMGMTELIAPLFRTVQEMTRCYNHEIESLKREIKILTGSPRASSEKSDEFEKVTGFEHLELSDPE